jgi:hypothetical protein
MRPVKQTVFGKGGNCFAACVASLLEIPVKNVPNFCHDHGDHWPLALKEWLAPLGLFPVVVNVPPSDDSATAFLMNDGATCIAGGKTASGADHACIHRGLKLLHDPCPGGEGLASIEDMTFLVPLAFNYKFHPEYDINILELESNP